MPAQPFASTTLIVKLCEAVFTGVPLITPVEVFRLRPVGSVPAVIEYTYGAVPAGGASEALKAVPTVAVVLMACSASTGQICSVRFRVLWHPFASVTRTEIGVAGEAEAVGVPESTPVVAFSVKPAGSVPLVIVQAV